MENSSTRHVEPDDRDRYAFGRGSHEIKRLASQHVDLLKFSGGLIQKQVDQTKLKNIADVATGSGIWLEDVAQKLNDRSNRYYGFDISGSQFCPANPGQDSITFVQHDFTLPFPEQYHGMFDLVNIRLVQQALEEKNTSRVVSNLVQLLHPGGYIQWQDVAFSTAKSVPPNKALDAIDDVIRDHMRFHGLSLNLPTQVESSMIAKGLQDVVLLDYDTPKDEGARIMKDCRFFMLPTTLRSEAMARGETPDPEKVKKRFDELTSAADEALAAGYYWHFNFPVIVARKP